MDTPTPDAIRTARTAAGLTQAACAALVGLGQAIRWTEYESGVRNIDHARWELFLLRTGQHPEYRLAKRRIMLPTPP